MVIKVHEVKTRYDYEREYHENDTTMFINLSRKDVENLISLKEVFNTTRWMCGKDLEGRARHDFVSYAIATKIAKMVLTKDEMKQLKEYNEKNAMGMFRKKERELLSAEAMHHISEYVRASWKTFRQYDLVSNTYVLYTKKFGIGRRKKTYTYKMWAVKLTEKGTLVKR